MDSSKPDSIRAERGRYHLYISHACPYSARAVLARCVAQLVDVVSMSALNPVRGPDGWVFGAGEYADPLNGFHTLRETYEANDSGYEGRISVPVLWDRQARRIVSTESGDIMRMFGGPLLCPEPLRAAIDALNTWIAERINDGVYDVGKATSQPAYEREHRKLLEALDELEQRLGKSPFLFGNEPVESDWRLFPTLVRFDAVYSRLFKCTRQLAEMPNLWRFTRDLYRRPGIAATVRHNEILLHYYRSFPALNPYGIVPSLPPPDFAAGA
ncbi:MAG TPA: glutathione S-transferase C-terminal domain-containing protein [Steroidobacteraceae bacterium]|nr:glutathione S-transferase C-terminal domain-containing protein [Steroidobacteraceae bacterium]